MLSCGLILDMVVRSIALLALVIFYRDSTAPVYERAYFRVLLASTLVAYGTYYGLKKGEWQSQNNKRVRAFYKYANVNL